MTTLREFLIDRMNTNAWSWMADWENWKSQSVIARRNGQVTDLKSWDAPAGPGLERVGWSGLSTDGQCRWLAWDIDVGHGKESFFDFHAGLLAAVNIWQILGGEAEVRVSTSGRGFHVRHKVTRDLSNAQGGDLAKIIAGKVPGLDPVPVSRQAFWFWAAKPEPGSFRQLLPAKGGPTDD